MEASEAIVGSSPVLATSENKGRRSTPAEDNSTVAPQCGGGSCGCGGKGAGEVAPPTFVYALGHIEARPRSLSVEKEIAQVSRREDTASLTNQQVLHRIVSERPNRYLARQLCWVFVVERVDTYILYPRDPSDFDLLIQSLRAEPQPTDVDVVVGIRGPIASQEACNGLMVPVVAFDQIYSFDIDGLIKQLPRPDKVTAKDFEPIARDVFTRILQMADNAGAIDEHRALNYLAVRDQSVYQKAVELSSRDVALDGYTARRSRLSGMRKIVDVILTFINRKTTVPEKYFVRVDVTDEFPFLATGLSPYYELQQ
jgi:hypothetical protein